jgi:hypothetical protein
MVKIVPVRFPARSGIFTTENAEVSDALALV